MNTCCKKINAGGSIWPPTYRACGKTAKFERDGKWYCGIHDPAAREAKNLAKTAAWHAEWDAKDNRRKFVEACEQAIRDIAAGADEPSAIAVAILSKEFGEPK